MLPYHPLSATQAALVHMVFEYGAISLGVWLYRRTLRQQTVSLDAASSLLGKQTFPIVVGLLLGAGMGNKAVFLFERPDVWRSLWAGQPVWPGQSIVGGLLGGLLGVELAKWLTGQTRSTGDAMVVPICIGLMVGRVGCFWAGLHDDTYGLPSNLPWAVDLGDGVARHPSPLYEMVFLAGWLCVLRVFGNGWSKVAGLSFKLFLSSYLLWRLLADMLKPVRQPYALGLSGIQWVCVIALAVYAPIVMRAILQRSEGKRSP